MTDDLFKRTGSGDFSKFLKVMVSGPPKSGKTTLLGTVPNILVLDTEPHANNLESIAHKDVAYVTITNSEDLRHVAMVLGNESLRKQLAQQKYGIPDIQAVAIDTLDTLQKILKTERMKEQRKSEFLRDDWGWLKTEMESIVNLFTQLPMHVFFMVHTKTKEMGKGDDAFTITLPGLEGAISESIAGMVGYSLLSFRKEELADDGTRYTKYWLRTEGDSTHDFLGTRVGGVGLPTIIEPDMATIYNTVLANRPKTSTPPPPLAVVPTPPPAPAPALSLVPPVEEVAQNPSQAEEVPTPVETPEAAAEPVAEPVAPQAPPAAEKPDDKEPVSPAALGHVKKVFDAIGAPFVDEFTSSHTMGEARTLVKSWKAIQQDHAEGKNAPDTTPESEMLEVLSYGGWLPPQGQEPEQVEEKVTAPKVDGTIDEVMAYVNEHGEGNLARVQEAYDLESAKGDSARAGLIKKLEGLGAQTIQTPVETPPEPAQDPVTSDEPAADTSPTGGEAIEAGAEQLLKDELGAVEVVTEAKEEICDVCGNPVDDYDLAELGMKRFDKRLCVNDYLAELKK